MQIYFFVTLSKDVYPIYINGPQSNNKGLETTDQETVIRSSTFLNREKKEGLHTKVCGKI